MWTRVEKTHFGGAARTKPAIRNNGSTCVAIFPLSMCEADRVDIFHDGSKIGFDFNHSGDFSLSSAGNSNTTKQVVIPASIRTSVQFLSVPTGTSDVEVTREGPLLVIDLTQFRKTRPVAAE